MYRRDSLSGLKTSAAGSNTANRDCLTEDEKLLTIVSLDMAPKCQSLGWFLQHVQFMFEGKHEIFSDGNTLDLEARPQSKVYCLFKRILS